MLPAPASVVPGGQPGAALFWQNAGVTSREIAGIARGPARRTGSDSRRGRDGRRRGDRARCRAAAGGGLHARWRADVVPHALRVVRRAHALRGIPPLGAGRAAGGAEARGGRDVHSRRRADGRGTPGGLRLLRGARTERRAPRDAASAGGAQGRDRSVVPDGNDGGGALRGDGRRCPRGGLRSRPPPLPRRGAGPPLRRTAALDAAPAAHRLGLPASLIAGYAVALFRHALTGTRYPFINDVSRERPQGVFAIEPHLARRDCGAKFESILVVDGDETRWLDPGLFGDVEG